jgi:dipeptidyl aminopeptidase/acylaminoacyl peptidase
MYRLVLGMMIGLVLITSCGSQSNSRDATLPAPVATIIPATLTPTVTPLPTATMTMDEAMYPFTIEGLRQHKYQSGKLRVLETLLQTDLFIRYLIEYPSEGLRITGVMQVPVAGDPPFPVIVMNHGFFARGDYTSGDGTDRAAEFLNRRGYLTLSSDYRSWGESDLGPSLYYSGLVIDVINMLNAIPSIAQADPERIGMWGHSMGGGVTIKVLTIDPRLKAAVLYSPVSADFDDLLHRWGLGCFGDVYAGELQLGCNSSDIVPLDLPPDLLQAYYDSSTDPEMLREVSPLYHLELVSTPVQIHYGVEDGRDYSGTPPEWSKKLYDGLKNADKEVRLFGYDKAGHSFIGDNWFAFMERSAQFFDERVKNAQ